MKYEISKKNNSNLVTLEIERKYGIQIGADQPSHLYGLAIF